MLAKLLPRNEHPADRALRVVFGLGLLSLVFVGPHSMWGLIGAVPLLTGLLGSCPEDDLQLCRRQAKERTHEQFVLLRSRDVLRDVEGLSGGDAAQVLGLGLPALKSRLHRARLRLMAAMREREGGIMQHERDAGGLRCRDVLARLGDYVDGDLIDSERAPLEAHLRGCSVCETFGGRYATVVAAARAQLGAAPAVDPARLARIREALSE